MKSERLSILVSPEDKARISARAATLHLSMGELVRRAVSAYKPENDHDELRTLATTLTEAVERAERRLDATLSRLAQFDDRAERIRREARAAARAEDTRWPFPIAQQNEAAQ